MKPPASTATARSAPLASALMWIAIFAVPLLVVPSLHESFREPKLLAAEWLGLASLLALAPQLGGRRIDWRGFLRSPAVVAVVPLLALATASLATSRHPLHVREALWDLGVGAACLIGWTFGFGRAKKERFFVALLAPAALLAFLAILQFHRLWEPLRFAGIASDPRLGVTSLAGNPGDLGAYLVLPLLAGVRALPAASRRARLWLAVALGLGLYALLATQTLAALAALAAGLLVFGTLTLRRRQLLAGLGAALVLGALTFATVAPLRTRVLGKLDRLAAGDWNDLLTGRLDGWRAALLMLREHPASGVGHGAFRPEFARAKLALVAAGVPFRIQQATPVFANAHNEALEVAADLGWPGVAALAWGLGVIGWAAWKRPGPPRARALFLAGLAALAVLSLVYFPFRIAMVAYPALLFLAWGLDPREEG